MNRQDGGATLIIGDKQYKVCVSEIEFTNEHDNYNSFGGPSGMIEQWSEISLSGRITEAKTVGMDLAEKGSDHTVVMTVTPEGNEWVKRQLLNEWKHDQETDIATLKDAGEDMGYPETDYEGDNLARKFTELELDSDEKLLRKHGITELDGTLTTKGKTFLLNVLFEQYQEEVVDALGAIDAVEKEERES